MIAALGRISAVYLVERRTRNEQWTGVYDVSHGVEDYKA